MKNLSDLYSKSTFNIVANFLSLTVFILAVYILTTPLLPELELILKNRFNPNLGFVYRSALAHANGINESDLKPPPAGNYLVIPKIGIEGAINEGTSIATLDFGIWRKPESSTPDKGGNTVLVAHRFLNGNTTNSFYHLPKLERGDRFVVYWNEFEYTYEVYEKREVLPTQTEIEKDTADAVITLYTCTPLWTSEKRLVIRAKPISLN